MCQKLLNLKINLLIVKQFLLLLSLSSYFKNSCSLFQIPIIENQKILIYLKLLNNKLDKVRLKISLQETLFSLQPSIYLCIFTHKDEAMSNAIEIVISQTHQRLCTWHIAKNATQQLVTYYARPGFKQYYNKCFYGCSNAIEFEASWVEMIKKFKLADHSQLKILYFSKEK